MQANKNLYYANIYIFLSNIFKPDQACFHLFKEILYIHRRVNTLFSFPLNLVCKGRRFFSFHIHLSAKMSLKKVFVFTFKNNKGVS